MKTLFFLLLPVAVQCQVVHFDYVLHGERFIDAQGTIEVRERSITVTDGDMVDVYEIVERVNTPGNLPGFRLVKGHKRYVMLQTLSDQGRLVSIKGEGWSYTRSYLDLK